MTGHSQDPYPRNPRYPGDTYATHYGVRRRPPERDDRRPSHPRYSPSPPRSRDETYHRQSTGSYHGPRTPERGISTDVRPISPESRRNETAGRNIHAGSRRSSGEWTNDGYNPEPPSMEGRGRLSDGTTSGRVNNLSTREVRMRSVSRSPERKPSPPVKIRRPPKSNPLTSAPIPSSQPTPPSTKQSTTPSPPEPQKSISRPHVRSGQHHNPTSQMPPPTSTPP